MMHAMRTPYTTMYTDDYPLVLDLSRSRRGDSVETRKTPSPAYSAGSSREDVSPRGPPPTGFLRYHHASNSVVMGRHDKVATTEDYMMSDYRPEMRQETISPFSLKTNAYQQPQLLLTSVPLTPPTSLEDNTSDNSTNFDCKATRPFKAYPRDPLALAAGFSATADSTIDINSAEKYCAFRERMLQQIRAANGGRATVCNPKMRRCSSVSSSALSPVNSLPEQQTDNSKDLAYYERRKKNNAAAKKSRDRRRVKEDEIAIRAAFLERENIELKFELAALRKQLAMSAANVAHVQC